MTHSPTQHKTGKQMTTSHHHPELMQDMAKCPSLKALVDSLENTGLFKVFIVSMGHPWKQKRIPGKGSTRAPAIVFWANAKDARKLANTLTRVDITNKDCRTRLPSGRLWTLDAHFLFDGHEYETVGILSCYEYNLIGKSLADSFLKFKLDRTKIDKDFNSLREFVEDAFPVLKNKEQASQNTGESK